MERFSFKFFLAVLFGIMSFTAMNARQGDPPVPNRIRTMFINEMIEHYPQEKVYLHLDKNHYVSGDTIWFRAHKVNAMAHLKDTLSRYVYVDLVNPGDSVVNKVKVRHAEGVYNGYIPLHENAAGGNYTLRAYTRYMLSGDEDYLYTTSVRISNPYSPKVNLEPSFDMHEGNRRLSGRLKVGDSGYKESDRTRKIMVGWGPGELKSYTLDQDGNVRLPSLRMKSSGRNSLLIHYDSKLAEYIDIPAAKDVFEVSFFPEGGHLLAGTANVVGFKVLDGNGAGVDVKGRILDKRGNEIADFSTIYAGMGKFMFTPQAGEIYYAECRMGDDSPKRFTLPAVYDSGIGLHTVIRGNKLYVSLRTSGEVKANGFIVIHVRGEVFFEGQFQPGADYMTFDASLLPEGVGHILLLDNNVDCNILSERLVYINGGDRTKVGFTLGKPHYGRREFVECGVSLTDEYGNALTGDFSVSVTDDNDIKADYGDNIRTSLLLTSDLRGYIESPGWYFDPENGVPAKEALDALMLTQGWRRYDMQRILKGDFYDAPGKFEATSSISGKVLRMMRHTGLPETEVLMMVPKHEFYMSAATDEDGRFVFSGFEFADTARIYTQAFAYNSSINVVLEMDKVHEPVFSIYPVGAKLRTSAPAVNDEINYISKSDEKYMLDNDGIRSILMDPIVIKADRMKQKIEDNPYVPRYVKDWMGNWYDEEYFKKWGIISLRDLLYRVPSVRVEDTNVFIRGGMGPVAFLPPARFVVDGVMMPRDFDWNMTFPNMSGVEFVTVLMQHESAMYGTNGAGGIILITHKAGSRNNPPKNTFHEASFMHQGYQSPIEFYSPKYETDESRYDGKKDLRTTLYWNPIVKSDKDGKAGFSFYTADNPVTYTVIIEGVTDDGRVIRAVEKIDRR